MGIEGVGEETLLRTAEKRMGNLWYNTIVHIARGLEGESNTFGHNIIAIVGGRDIRCDLM